jgi:hypothetical protein
MRIIIMLTLLVAPYRLLIFTNVPEGLRGRIGLALVYLLTSLGHFVKTTPTSRCCRVGEVSL